MSYGVALTAYLKRSIYRSVDAGGLPDISFASLGDDDAVDGRIGAVAVYDKRDVIMGRTFDEIFDEDKDRDVDFDDVQTWHFRWLKNNPGTHLVYVDRLPRVISPGVLVMPAVVAGRARAAYAHRHTHVGQLKLFVGVATFVAQLLQEEGDIYVTYVGAAPGFASMPAFSNQRIKRVVLIDPRFADPAFDPRYLMRESRAGWAHDVLRKLTIVPTTYDGAEMRVPEGARAVLISDIRNTTDDAAILEDQLLQMEWSRKYSAASLKWRAVGAADGTTLFPHGVPVFHQPYRAPFSAEVRLFIRGRVMGMEHRDNRRMYAEAQYFNRQCTDDIAGAAFTRARGAVGGGASMDYFMQCVEADVALEGHVPVVAGGKAPDAKAVKKIYMV